MVIKGNVPRNLSTAHRGVSYTRYTKDGRAIMAAWPKRRPGPLPPITQEQVARWDKAITWARSPEPRAFALALEATKNNAFYARDIILMETYGNYVSWPGWGRYPNGPEGGEVKYPRGTLKEVDAVRTVNAYRNGGTLKVDMTIWEPSEARLYVSTLEPQSAVSRVWRQGVSVPHGAKLWMPEALGEYAPDSGDGGQQQSWSVPDPAPDQDTIWWWVANKGADSPIVEWSSAVYPEQHTGPRPSFGWWYVVMGFTVVPAGTPPDPIVVAQLNAQTDATASCLIAQQGVSNLIKAEGILFNGCSAVGFSGADNQSPFPQCFNFDGLLNGSMPPSPSCVDPDASFDGYYWWILFLYS